MGILNNFFLHEVKSKVADMARLNLVGVLYSCRPDLIAKEKYTILLINMIKLSRADLQGFRKQNLGQLFKIGVVSALQYYFLKSSEVQLKIRAVYFLKNVFVCLEDVADAEFLKKNLKKLVLEKNLL